jgi:NAD(P)-dependent dehydrogenase (short-subunit alcohol dehydrogenase family)
MTDPLSPAPLATEVNVVIGASRGLGAAIAAELAARDPACPVLATVRGGGGGTPTGPFPPSVIIVPGVDIAADACVGALRAAVGDRFIRTLIISAAAMAKDAGAASLDGPLGLAAVEAQFQANALGPVRVAAALAGRVRPGGKIVLVASRTGLPARIAAAGSGGMVGYRASKSAALAVGAILAAEVKGQGVAVASIHPGTIATDMYAAWHGSGSGGGGGGGGGGDAAAATIAPRTHPPVAAAAAAARFLNVVETQVTLETTGKVWDEEGREMAY